MSFVAFLGKLSIQNFKDVLISRYHEYGPIFKETIAGETVVHLLDPEFIKVIYLTEGKVPHIPPLLETTQRYRELRGLSPGLGNTYVWIFQIFLKLKCVINVIKCCSDRVVVQMRRVAISLRPDMIDF